MTIDTQRRSLAPSFLAERLENAINQALIYAPGTQLALSQLAGKSVSLVASRPKLQLTLEIDQEEIRVYHHWEGTPTVAIKGPLITILFQLGLNKSPGELVASGIQVEGDQAFAQQLASLFREMDLDLEDPLAGIIGDVAAYQVGQAARSALSWLKKATTTLLNDSSHYLREESHQVVEKAELETFSRNIDCVRADFDRLEARVQQLQQKSTTPASDTSSNQKIDNPFNPTQNR